MPTARRHASTAALLVLTLALPCAAQQNAAPNGAKAVADSAFKADAPGLHTTADLSYVLTSGNATADSLGFKGDLVRRFTRHAVSFTAGGLRASSSPDSRYATGDPSDPEIVVPDPQLTAAYYYGRGRYDFKLSNRLFVTAGGGWERNRFSGIENRWLVDSGLGVVLVSDETTSFRGSLGVTWASEQYTVEDGRDGSFVGARLGWDLQRKLLPNTTFTHTLIADENLEDTEDLRVDAHFGLHVAMSKTLGLKVNWRLLWDNQPALAEFPYFVAGMATGQTVLAPYRKLDQGLSVSLVFDLARPSAP